MYKKYPPQDDCKSIEGLFESLEEFEEHAKEDKEATQVFKGRGYYHCYCKKYSGVDLLIDELKEHICYTYQRETKYEFVFQQALSFTVIGLNFVIKLVNPILVQSIGYHTRSDEIKKICL